MTANAREVLQAFQALPPEEQRQVMIEILRNGPDQDELSESELNQLADELFCRYDAEEAARAHPAE